MQFVKRVGRFVHLQPLAINRRLATRRMSYAPDAHARTHRRRTHAPGVASSATLLQLSKAASERMKERQRLWGRGRRREDGKPDERPCWQFFMHLTIETTTLPCPGHPSIYSFIHLPARSLAHSCARAFIHSLKHSLSQVAVRLVLVGYLLGAQWLKSSALTVLDICALQWVIDTYRLAYPFAEEVLTCIDFCSL